MDVHNLAIPNMHAISGGASKDAGQSWHMNQTEAQLMVSHYLLLAFPAGPAHGRGMSSHLLVPLNLAPFFIDVCSCTWHTCSELHASKIDFLTGIVGCGDLPPRRKRILSPDAYRVLRQEGTELPFAR
eukprot:1142612-Pelagomonas_calceolata.AAC.3